MVKKFLWIWTRNEQLSPLCVHRQHKIFNLHRTLFFPNWNDLKWQSDLEKELWMLYPVTIYVRLSSKYNLTEMKSLQPLTLFQTKDPTNVILKDPSPRSLNEIMFLLWEEKQCCTFQLSINLLQFQSSSMMHVMPTSENNVLCNIFIPPRSDHCFALSISHWLTHVAAKSDHTCQCCCIYF